MQLARAVSLTSITFACGSGDATPGSSAADASSSADAGSEGSADSTAEGGAAGEAGPPVDGSTGGTPPECMNEPPAATLVHPFAADELVIEGDPGALLGHFDPSPIYPAGAAAGALAYSAVPAQDAVSTRIAVSSDAGATFTYVANVNSSTPVTVTTKTAGSDCASGCTGKLIHEVPSLAFDPMDSDPSRRFKVFTHSYAVLPGDDLRRELGYIGIFTAPDPQGPWKDEGKAIGWQSDSDFSSVGAGTVATKFGQLADCVVLTEPGAFVIPGGIIDLALGCASLSGGSVGIRIVILRSFDHGKKWSFVSTAISPDDALCLGGDIRQFNAPHVFLADGKLRLLASPASKKSGDVPEGYRGCHTFDLTSAGTVIHDGANLPLSRRFLSTPDERFHGACAYAEGATSLGYLMSVLRPDTPPRVFRIYKTGVAAP